jgi:O-antigen/teichoic acid export membrane protein
MSIKLNKKIKNNTYKNAIFQGVSIFIGFYMYPLLMGYIDNTTLGIWFTLISLASWFTLLDVGISNGLRNKLSSLIIANKIKLARVYISSTYFYFSAIITLVFIVGNAVISSLNLDILLNVESGSISNLNLSVCLVFSTVLLNLLFTINNSLANAQHNSSFSNYRLFIYSVAMIVSIIFMSSFKNGSLLKLSCIYFGVNMLSNVLTTIQLYIKNTEFLPTYKLISFKHFKTNIKKSLDFFIINISSVVMFSTDTFLITHFLGPESVVAYTMTMKVLVLFLTLLWLYTGTLWSAYTDSYIRKDFVWIQRTLKRTISISFFLIIAMAIVAYNFDIILQLWVKTDFYYDPSLVLCIFLVVSLRIWNGNFSTLLNGVGKTLVQKNSGIVSTLVNIPLSIFLMRDMGMGSEGVALGTAFSLSLFAILGPVFTWKFINEELNIEN